MMSILDKEPYNVRKKRGACLRCQFKTWRLDTMISKKRLEKHQVTKIGHTRLIHCFRKILLKL